MEDYSYADGSGYAGGSGKGEYGADGGYGEGDYGEHGDSSEGYDDEAGTWVPQNSNGQYSKGRSGGARYHNYAHGPAPYVYNGSSGGGGVQYKSKLCHDFMATGFCAKGFSCGYAHGQHELVRNLMHMSTNFTKLAHMK